jgi:D-alanine transaminase
VLALCVLDGRVLPLAEARLDPLDRGFVYGDGVYEVVRVRAGVALYLDDHLARLRRSLEAVAIPEPAGVAAACADLVARSGLEDGSLYLQVSRGVAPRVHLPPRDLAPTLFILPSAHPHAPSGERPLRAVTVPDWRWGRCDIKATSLMGTVLGKLRARDAGADEVVFVSAAGELREGGSASLFVARGARLETYPLDGGILPSLTRARVLAAAARLGIATSERPPLLAERREWSEAFLCGTLTGVQPLVELDGQMVGDGGDGGAGSVGEMTRRLGAAHDAEERAAIAAAGAPETRSTGAA